MSLIAIVPFMLTGCANNTPVTQNEVPGVYVLSHDGVTDTLVLSRDGSFDHHLWDGVTLSIQETGKWRQSEYPDKGAAVEFSGISPFADRPAPHARAPGTWLARLGRNRSGTITLMVNRDIGLAYERQP